MSGMLELCGLADSYNYLNNAFDLIPLFLGFILIKETYDGKQSSYC
jgi:hypothetical protein